MDTLTKVLLGIIVICALDSKRKNKTIWALRLRCNGLEMSNAYMKLWIEDQPDHLKETSKEEEA